MIRKATPLDIKTIQQIRKDCNFMRLSWSVHRLFIALGMVDLLLDENESTIGYCSFISLFGVSYIIQFGLTPDSRGQGIGSNFLTIMCDRLAGDIWAHTTYDGATKFFMSNNWSPVYKFHKYTIIRRNGV